MMVDIIAGAITTLLSLQYAAHPLLIDEQKSIRHLVSPRGDHDFHRYVFSKHKIFLHWYEFIIRVLVILLSHYKKTRHPALLFR